MTNFKQANNPLLLNNNSKPLFKKKNTKIVTANHTHTYKQTCKFASLSLNSNFNTYKNKNLSLASQHPTRSF